MTFIPAQALEDWSLLSITLSWTDALGNPGFAMATPVPYGTEQAFWAQVDVAAPLDQLVITISHPNHPEYVFDPANGSTLLNVVDSGAVMDMLTAIPITAMANEMFADTYTLYVSTQMMPQDPSLTASAVTVVYRYEDGEIIDQQSQTVQNGEIVMATSSLVSGLTPVGASEVQVQVVNGVASPNPVEFVYARPITTATVDVVYRYEDGEIIDQQSQTVQDGEIVTATSSLVSGLTPVGASQVQVQVVNGVASPNPVEFVYARPIAEEVYADITISFVDEDGNPVATAITKRLTAGRHNVAAEPADLLDGYTIVGEQNVTVEVSDEGVADPSSISFVYSKPADEPTPEVSPVTATVTVMYLAREDNNHKVAADQSFNLEQGVIPVAATPENLEEGYTLDGPASQEVTVDAQGNASPNPVIFYYQKAEEPQPAAQAEITIRYTDTKNADIVTPQTRLLDANNVYAIGPDVAIVPAGYSPLKADAVTVTVDANGVADVTEVVFVYQVDVEDTPIPVDTLIQRWGYTTAKEGTINWRDQPSKSGRLLGKLSQNTYVWLIKEEINDKNEKWTKVLHNGQEGYIMSEYLVCLTEAEGDYYEQINNITPVPTQSAEPTQEPTEAPTDTPAPPEDTTEAPTDTPAPPENTTEAPTDTPALPTDTPTPKPTAYVGYAKTNRYVALRNGMDNQEASILTMLNQDTLVKVMLQTTDENGTLWSYCSTMDSNPISGMIEDSALTRISDAEAQAIIDANATPTPAPTAEPPQQSGYAVARGDNVYMRTLPSELSGISHVLSAGAVAYVTGQQYVLNNGTYEIWHVVQYESEWGYIRADLMRMLDPWEEEQYLNSLKTPSPTLVTTPQPYDENNLSSYGYVASSTVNFRQSASTSSTRLATLRQYAFCLVLGTTQVNGTTWYRVNYGGTVGYIQGDYFKQLTIAELEDFLLSPEYTQGIANNSSNSGGSTSGSGGTSNLPSAEDQTVQEWTNPNSGINVSYEPFDPFATPAPLATESPSASASPSAEATTIEPLETLPVEYPTQETESGEGGSAVGWVIAAAVVLLGGGGGGYAYMLHKQNQRKAAQRAAQRRAAAQRTGTDNTGRPYARTGSAAQPRTGTYNASGTATPAQRTATGAATSGTASPTQRAATGTAAGAAAAGTYGSASQARRPYGNESGKANAAGTNNYANFQRPTTGTYGTAQGSKPAGSASTGTSASSYGTQGNGNTASTYGTAGTATPGTSASSYGTQGNGNAASTYGTAGSASTGTSARSYGTQGNGSAASTYGTAGSASTGTSASSYGTQSNGSTASTYGTAAGTQSTTSSTGGSGTYGTTSSGRTGASSYGRRAAAGTNAAEERNSAASTGMYGQATGASTASTQATVTGATPAATPKPASDASPAQPAKPTGASAYGSQRRSAANGQPVRRASRQNEQNVDFSKDNDSDL